MQKRLFITGPSGSGKSTMIREALGDQIHRAGGFITLRDRGEDGRIRGFELAASDGSGLPERFLDFTGEKPRVSLEVFSRTGARLLNQADQFPYAVVDEIGGVELLDDAFVQALARFLAGDTPCIGVMKGDGPVGQLVKMMGLTLRYELARQALFRRLTEDPDTLVVKTMGRDDPEAREIVAQWVKEYT